MLTEDDEHNKSYGEEKNYERLLTEEREKLSREYFHIVIALCVGLILLIYVLTHVVICAHDRLSRQLHQRQYSQMETLRLIETFDGGNDAAAW